MSVFSLPQEDTRSKYMTIPAKPPEIKPEELYKLPKRPKKSDNPLEEAKRLFLNNDIYLK